MRTLPRPLPDELLYSALARATYRYGFWSPKRLLDILYGRRTVVAVPDLPSNLSALVQSTHEHWQLDVDELVAQHTLLGYYTHFQGGQQRRKVLAAMADVGGSLHVRLGVCAGSARTPKCFQLCPTCYVEDIAAFGEAYWHRAHHLPGVLVCYRHGEILKESEVPFRPIGRHAYAAASMTHNIDMLSPVVQELKRPRAARAVALRSFELLTTKPSEGLLRPDYRERLGRWRVGHGRAARFEQDFVAHFGEDLLLASFGRQGCHLLGWLKEALRAPRRAMHPFKHVLMEVFLAAQSHSTSEEEGSFPKRSEKSWGVYRVPALREEASSLACLGWTTNAIAWALDVDWKTAERLLAPLPIVQSTPARNCDDDKNAWVAMAAAHPAYGKKELRSVAPALYARLYRHDRHWLLSWTPVAQREVTATKRVDWPARDVETEARVRRQVAMTMQEHPPRRASKNYILGRLGLRALLAHRSTMLPLTTATLHELCETVDAYQLRRLQLVLCDEGMAELPDWRLLREARIEPGRFADGAKSLLHRARQSLGCVKGGEPQQGVPL
jgi:hypothetical protein